MRVDVEPPFKLKAMLSGTRWVSDVASGDTRLLTVSLVWACVVRGISDPACAGVLRGPLEVTPVPSNVGR